MTITSGVEHFFREIRFAFRTLRKDRGFSATCILTIALGIGINVSAFTLINAIAMRPLHAPGAEKLVMVYQDLKGKTSRHVWGNASLFSYPEYLKYRDESRVFSGLLAHSQELNATVPGVGVHLVGDLSTCNYFDVLESAPSLGRGFYANECSSPGSGSVVVLSDTTWRNYFSADPKIVGKVVRFNQRPLMVIGVARPGFHGTELRASDFWTPIVNADMLNQAGTPEEQFLTRENLSWLVMIGRVRDGVSLRQVRASLDIIAAQIDRQTPGKRTILIADTANLVGTPEERTDLLAVSTVAQFAIGLILLIGCANLTNIMLARAASRRREIAVRLAIGATRTQLVLRTLAESLVLSFVGGALGTYLAIAFSDLLLKTLISKLPPDTPALDFALTPDIRVFGYCLVLMLLTTLLVGCAPAIQSSRVEIVTTLKLEGLQASRTGKSHLRGWLVGAQVTMCTLMLISAGLLLHGVVRGEHVDPGFNTEQTAALRLDLTRQGYGAAEAFALRADIIERLRAIPSIASVAEVQNAPLAGRHEIGEITVESQGTRTRVEFNQVSAQYFSTVQIPIVQGRAFSEQDMQTGAAVAVVTRATARSLWPGQDPIRKMLYVSNQKPYEVVGVTADTRSAYLTSVDTDNVYLPLPSQEPSADVIVRFKGGYSEAASAIRAVVKGSDPNITYGLTRTVENTVTWLAPARVSAILASILGALALILAMIGIYGTISYTVSKRLREICIRMVLGADTGDIHNLVIGQTARPVLVGVAAGTLLSLGAAQVLRSLLFGVSTFDTVSFAPVLLLLLGTALLAAYLPARRATRLDPASALNAE